MLLSTVPIPTEGGLMPKRWKTVAVITVYERDQRQETDERAEEYDTEEEARRAFNRMRDGVRPRE
jgi:hypothetical protein